MLKQIEEIQRGLMKKGEVRPFNWKREEDGNFNYIHQMDVADAFAEVRKLIAKEANCEKEN